MIRSTGHTNFTATKRVELTDHAFASQPASRQCHDRYRHPFDCQARRRPGQPDCLQQGWQRARQNAGQAEAIAADHAEDRIERRFNEDVNEKLRDARERYEDEYRDPLARRGELPEHIRFSSDKDSISLEATQASRGQLAATERSARGAGRARHDDAAARIGREQLYGRRAGRRDRQRNASRARMPSSTSRCRTG